MKCSEYLHNFVSTETFENLHVWVKSQIKTIYYASVALRQFPGNNITKSMHWILTIITELSYFGNIIYMQNIYIIFLTNFIVWDVKLIIASR